MDTARIFFLFDENRRLHTLRAVTLESHLENVTRLTKVWSPQKAFLQVPLHLREQFKQTRPKLIQAARRHDEGKRQRFRITWDEKKREWNYSYRGHRFDVTDSDLYVELLIRLHHQAYSVGDINDAIARLRLQPELSDFAELFPFDAYALQMCDQITAEVEIYALDDSKNPRKPEFMEFKTEKQNDGTIAVEPYPFESPKIHLKVSYADIAVPTEIPQDADNKLTNLVREAQNVSIQDREVTLCPAA